MSFLIKITSIPLLKNITEESAKRLEKSFRIIKQMKDQVVLEQGKAVPGLFIVGKGSVNVYTKDFKTLIANLPEGSSFGEMSLIEKQKASASIKVATDEATLLFCPQHSFSEHLDNDLAFAEAFFRASSMMLSARLRSTNSLIETELDKGFELLQKAFKQDHILDKMEQTRGFLNETGSSLMTELQTLMPVIDNLAEKYPQLKDVFDKINDFHCNMLLTGQNFDRLSQQMDHMKQYLENLQQVLKRSQMKEIEGDEGIFE